MLFSANEYVTHRYYQHNEIGKMYFYKTLRKFGLFPKIDGGGHVEHHAETYDRWVITICIYIYMCTFIRYTYVLIFAAVI